jgi:hypothetical protein
MKRALKVVLIGGFVSLLALIAAVNMIAVPLGDTSPPDPAMLIQLPDGANRRLDELLQAFDAGDPPGFDTPVGEPDADETAALPGSHQLLEQLQALDGLSSEEARELTRAAYERHARSSPSGKTLFSLAEWHRHNGNLDQAQALYESVPASDGQWSRAHRRLGWDVYTKGHDSPARGVAYVHESLRSDPMDGNAWQDAARVYLATVGLPVD